jgi:hypothetical protein
MYTIDASVWVNAFDQREPGHAASRQLLVKLPHRRGQGDGNPNGEQGSEHNDDHFRGEQRLMMGNRCHER